MAYRGHHLQGEVEMQRGGTDNEGTPGGHQQRVGDRRQGKYNQKPSKLLENSRQKVKLG